MWTALCLHGKEAIHISDTILNHITFGTDDTALAAFHFMLRGVQRTSHPLGSIDFNHLIPMPRDLSMEHSDRTVAGLELYQEYMKERTDLMTASPFVSEDERSTMDAKFRTKWDAIEQQDPEIWRLGEQAYKNIVKYNCPTWYEWREQHWGIVDNATKFAYLNEVSDTMVFTTNRTAVPKLVQAMSERFPKQKITYSWADGDTMQHLGRMVFRKGKAIELDIPQDPVALAQAKSAGICQLHAAAKRSSQPRKKAGHREQRR